MRATCPDCGADAHLSAFFVEADGKRLAALLAPMAPELGRAVIGYLGLFKPAKTALRLSRAVKLVEDLRFLVDTGAITDHERGRASRPATPALWAAGIEQMLAQRAALTLPMKNHFYLRAIVYGLADQADAAAERRREADARVGKHLDAGSGKRVASGESKLQNALRHIDQQLGYGALTEDEARQRQAEARREHGNG